jgi:hypothetical protein
LNLNERDYVMTVGDVNSQERGSGARFNDGKPAVELIPLRIISAFCIRDAAPANLCHALDELGQFQSGADHEHLYRVIGLLDPAWDECARVFDYGRYKYAAWNWAKGMDWSIPIACAARHLLRMIEGEQIDPESGLPHRGHVLCNIVMLLTFIETYPEGDDRPKAWLSRTGAADE